MRKAGLFYFWAVLFFFMIFSSVVLGKVNMENRHFLTEEQKAKLSKLSIPFIENRGQHSDKVLFYAKTFGGTVFLTKDGDIVYSLPKIEEKSAKGNKPAIKKGVAFREKLVGAKGFNIRGVEKSVTKVNIFKGKDPKKWKRNLNTYRTVSIGEVYEGIEVRLRAYGNNVEKLFYVKPGADPKRIRIKLEGVKGIEVGKDGKLILKTDLGEVSFTKPVAYQEVNGKRKYVEVSYVKVSEKEYGFRLGKYDRTKPVIIDPLLASTYLGGNGDDQVYAITIDGSGNVYVAGYTSSSDFPTTTGAYDTSHNGSFDAFVSKLNNDLSYLLASTYLGGNRNDQVYAITIDGSGNVYVAGFTASSDFPTTTGAYDTSYNGGIYDVFVSKLVKDLSSGTTSGGCSMASGAPLVNLLAWFLVLAFVMLRRFRRA